MALICPQCSQANDESTTFCRKCGYRIQGNEAVSNEATIRPSSLANLPADADPSDTLRPANQPAPASQPLAAPQPAPVMSTPQPQSGTSNPGVPAYPQQVATPNSGQAQGQVFAQPAPGPQGAYGQQPVYGQYAGQAPYGGQTPGMVPQQPGSGLGILQRAFAGKGTPVHHQSWLLDNKQAQPHTLRNSFIENINRQGVMGVTANVERLHEQGLAMEERDFTRVQYGTSSVFVYMAPMGQSLYVSRTSTVKQPYSTTRIIVVVGLFILMLISLLLFALIKPTFDPATGTYVDSGLIDALNVFFGYAFFGLLFFFIIALVRSIVFALTDQDFLAVLRPNRLNDFTLDALSSIEQTTDRALRATLRDAGLDAEAIQAPAQGYSLQQPLRRV